MRISLLEKREDFYFILEKTVNGWANDGLNTNSDNESYAVNRYLNFIASQNLETKVFAVLIKEYSQSNIKWLRLFQKMYVKLSVSKLTRIIFSHKTLYLSNKLENFLIIGGNHRIRLIDHKFFGTYVILKHNENCKFIQNEIILRNGWHLEYAPKLLDNGVTWILEEYFEGTPLNRLYNAKIRLTFLKSIIHNHVTSLLLPSVEFLFASHYLDNKRYELFSIIQNSKILIHQEIKDLVIDIFNYLDESLRGNYEVKISWSHGDFQTGNILISENVYKIIDWEASDKRYWLYDIFTLFGDIRRNHNLELAYKLFLENKFIWSNSETLDSNWMEWIALEELFFCIYEDCSLNFYKSGLKVKELCIQINSHFKL